MTWNYRIIKYPKNQFNIGSDEPVGLHEVYYDEKGNITAYSVDPIISSSQETYEDSIKDIIESLRLMLSDAENRTTLEQSVLDEQMEKGVD